MTDRERFVRTILGEPVDRPPYWLTWGPWATTWRRWEREGKPEHVTDHRTAFDPDELPRVVPVNCGPCPRIETTVLKEDQETVTFIDGWGIKRVNFKNHESMSQFLEFPVKNRKDWERFKEERLDPDHPARLEGDWRALCAEWTAQGLPIQLGYFPDVGIYGSVRWLLGDEECLMAFYTMPDLLHEIMGHMTSVYLTVFETVANEFQVDMIHIWEDMCSRQGPLIGPDQWIEFMGPQYRRIKAFAERCGIPVLSVDTDGDPDLIAPAMIDAGVNYLFPMEVAAGCDVNQWRAKYPPLALMGGIDKRALAQGPEAIDAELARVRPALEKGRYIPELDHLIPDDVSWPDYCHYVQRLRELVGKP
ncbi:MAG TPA: hypothetical protein HPP77_01545 [Candidatus Hydrogenedentes bacterium]|nr:hypothetical protein [Candidatus Hydrogenedentota bacterium]